MLSLGIPASRAWSIAVRRRGLPSGSPPPSLATTAISRASLLNSLPRTRSTFCFFSRILCHFEWPDMPPPRYPHSTTGRHCEGRSPVPISLSREIATPFGARDDRKWSLLLNDQRRGGPAAAGTGGRHGHHILHATDGQRRAEHVGEAA